MPKAVNGLIFGGSHDDGVGLLHNLCANAFVGVGMSDIPTPRKPFHKRHTFWITVWAVAIVSYVVVANISATWATALITMCSAIIMVYIGGEGITNVRHGPE